MPVFQITHQTNNQTNTDAHTHQQEGEHNIAHRHRTTFSIKTGHFDLERHHRKSLNHR